MSRMVRGWQTPEGSGFGVGMLNVRAERTLVRTGNRPEGRPAVAGATTERGACSSARFSVTKFRPTTLRPQDFGELKHIDGVGPGR